MENITDHKSVIAALGGSPLVARKTGAQQGAVRQWILRNRIPVEYWLSLCELAAYRGIKLDTEWLIKTIPAKPESKP